MFFRNKYNLFEKQVFLNWDEILVAEKNNNKFKTVIVKKIKGKNCVIAIVQKLLCNFINLFPIYNNDHEETMFNVGKEFRTKFERMYSFFFFCFFFCWGGKMAKYFIDVVQDSPRTGLGIPVETKKAPLSNQYTTRGTAFRL